MRWILSKNDRSKPIGQLFQQQIREESLQYSKMTEVLVEEQQLELVNIVQVVQSNLSKNFAIVLRKLANHDTRLVQSQSSLRQEQSLLASHLSALQQQLADQTAVLTAGLQDILRKVQTLEEGQLSLKDGGDQIQAGMRRVNDQLFNTQLQFQERLKTRETEITELREQVSVIGAQQFRLSEEVGKKQNKEETERLVKETERLKEKNAHIESELKLATHKIEKMEILSEKAQRLQAKKEVQIFKEIEEKVRKEIKSSLTPQQIIAQKEQIQQQNGNLNSTQQSIITNNYNIRQSIIGSDPLSDIANEISPEQLQKLLDQDPSFLQSKRGSFINKEENTVAGLNRIDLLHSNIGSDSYLQKWSEKMRNFEIQLKEVRESVKTLIKGGRKESQRDSKENNQGIRDKINELKPEVVKLWAKVDTIEDRLSFNERKLEDKLKAVTDLTTIIKENNVSRLEQKLKNLQTEIFTSLKQVRTKLEGKVTQTDYDKFCLKLEERLTQVNQLIFLKSDKLQVKKALLFLEAKIKEIILVISEDEQNEKDALLTKKQLKCISCDKELDKFSGLVSSPKGNWDSLPFKDHPPEILGRFGMTNFGSLAKKVKKLENKDLPILNNKRSVNQSFQNS